VDAFAGIVKISGWEETTHITYDDFLNRLAGQGITQIVFTDISQDGTLSGPNLISYKHILDTYNFDLIASGGIASMKDILELSSIKAKKKLFGIITGKAIYEGHVIDVEFAPFFLRQIIGTSNQTSNYSFLDDLASLDKGNSFYNEPINILFGDSLFLIY
jgi:phosphoribosylformimino-5-aminoimidazole carboxamide ribonucleotide (ProFAR) isomerase